MTPRTMLGGLIAGGLMGMLFTVGPAGASPGGLPQCRDELKDCNADLDTCQEELAAWQAEPTVVFPGDGAGHGPALSYTDHGERTFTDNNTQLMWEKTLAATDAACTASDQANRNLHCVN